jgi:hypothetical protein
VVVVVVIIPLILLLPDLLMLLMLRGVIREVEDLIMGGRESSNAILEGDSNPTARKSLYWL